MIAAWMGKKALFGLARGIWIAIALGVFALLWGYFSALETADDIANQEIGATTERAETVEDTLEQVEQGNAVRNETTRQIGRGGGAVVYEQCLRYDVGAPESCERFLPQLPTNSSGY